MTRTILHASLVSTLMVAGALSTALRAEETKSATPPVVRCRTVATPAAKEAYTVYISAAGCLRTFRQSGKFDTAREALYAAQELRKTNELVWVATGESTDNGWGLHPSQRAKLKVTGCSVYGLSCSRSGWQLTAKADTADGAEKLAEQLKKDVRLVEVVYHLASR